MNDDALLPFSLPSVGRKKVTAAFDGGRLTSDGGVLLLAGADQQLGLAETLASVSPQSVVHHSLARRYPARAHLRDRLWLSRCRRPRSSAPRPGVQAGLRAVAGERRRPGLAANHLALGERARSVHAAAAGLCHGGLMVSELPPPAKVGDAGYRRHGRCGARPAATVIIQCPLRRALLSADPRV
jgi:hypothetical protein